MQDTCSEGFDPFPFQPVHSSLLNQIFLIYLEGLLCHFDSYSYFFKWQGSYKVCKKFCINSKCFISKINFCKIKIKWKYRRYIKHQIIKFWSVDLLSLTGHWGLRWSTKELSLILRQKFQPPTSCESIYIVFLNFLIPLVSALKKKSNFMLSMMLM